MLGIVQAVHSLCRSQTGSELSAAREICPSAPAACELAQGQAYHPQLCTSFPSLPPYPESSTGTLTRWRAPHSTPMPLLQGYPSPLTAFFPL